MEKMVITEKTLIVYYSNSGTCEKIALHIKKLLPAADINRIGYAGKNYKRHSMFSALFKIFGEPKQIEGDSCDPSAFDRLILVFPIWAGVPAPVMRAYIKKNAAAFKEKSYNAVCVSGGGEDKALEWFKARDLNPPAEKLSLKQKRVEADDYNLTGVI